MNSIATEPSRTVIALACLIALASCILVISPSTPARAAEVDATCIGTQHTTFSPGLTLTPRDVTLTVNTLYTPCKSLSVPALTSATQTSSFVVPNASCLNPFDPGSGTKIIEWNTGQTSTFSFNRIGTNVGGSTIVTEIGLITAGLFAGDNAVEVVTGPTLDSLECLSETGITDRFNILKLEITSP
jgi:hypothetical protein